MNITRTARLRRMYGTTELLFLRDCSRKWFLNSGYST